MQASQFRCLDENITAKFERVMGYIGQPGLPFLVFEPAPPISKEKIQTGYLGPFDVDSTVPFVCHV